MAENAYIAGATGLTGGHLLPLLAKSYSSVICAGRSKPEPLPANCRFEPTDFASPSMPMDLAAVFCCLGTTLKKAGSKEAFRKVDFDYVVNLAKAAQSADAQRFLVISAMGANRSSSVFYNQVKGEMEQAVRAAFKGELHILQPSLLLGDRQEVRLGERVAILITPFINPLLCGPLRKYRGINAAVVARAMLRLALGEFSQSSPYQSDVLQTIGGDS